MFVNAALSVLASAAGPIGDRELMDAYIGRMADGDTDALKDLYMSARDSVYAYAFSLLKNTEDAEDVLHDVFVSAYRSAAGYKPCGKAINWLMVITRNICLMKIRSGRNVELLDDDSWNQVFSKMKGISDEDGLFLRDCMKALDDTERKIVILHAVAGFKHREIADHMDMPLSTVLSKYNRALKKLRSILKEGEENEEG
jgi:RNA polymerase sigma factor, sigma-70 family